MGAAQEGVLSHRRIADADDWSPRPRRCQWDRRGRPEEKHREPALRRDRGRPTYLDGRVYL